MKKFVQEKEVAEAQVKKFTNALHDVRNDSMQKRQIIVDSNHKKYTTLSN